MLYDKMLAHFRMEFGELKTNSNDFRAEIKDCYKLCNRTLNQMRKAVAQHGFANEDEEICFFKEIKVEPMSFLIYYAEVSSYLAHSPKNHENDGLKYTKKQISRVDDFLTKHIDFLIYMESRDTHLDPYYFTREFLRNNMNMHRYPYLKDEEFDTDKDYLLAKIRGWGMYVAYLKKQLGLMEGSVPNHDGVNPNPLKFTGRPIDKSELFYSLLAAGVFNHGNARMIDIIRGFGHIMGDDEQEVYRRLGELKKRKDPAVFLRYLILKLERFLEEDDAMV